MKTVIIGHFGGYRKMYSFGWTCLIYHATTLFCRRNYNYKNDALGKTVGQMVGAARSARQNIVEASSRAATSKEQELKQLDVAKGSLDELAGDYEAFLVDAGEALSCLDERLGRFRVPRQRAFVNGALRRFVFARSARHTGRPTAATTKTDGAARRRPRTRPAGDTKPAATSSRDTKQLRATRDPRGQLYA